MKHNYVSWELTQMLPEINPDSLINVDEGIYTIFICKDEPEYHIQACENLNDYYHISDIREAWSWEDIRLYLLSKGFEINIYRNDSVPAKYEVDIIFPAAKIAIVQGVVIEPFPASNDLYWVDRPTPFEYKEWDTYEECRIESIKWCLNQIKNK